MNTNFYKLKLYIDEDYSNVVNNIVSVKYLNKYLNKGFIWKMLKFSGFYNSDFYILEDNNQQIIAGGVIRQKFNFRILRKTYWLYGIEVKKENRGEGIGKILIKELLAILHNRNIDCVYLKVEKTNNIALKLYLKFGFRIHSETAKYYTLICKI
jgi:ribosomal protein S18 acetylase RimI-like enzyme